MFEGMKMGFSSVDVSQPAVALHELVTALAA
jgi:hypothetical protein